MRKTDLLIADLIHDLETLQGLLHIDTDVLLSQRAGPEAVVEVEQAFVVLDPQESSDIVKVGQGG